MPILTNRLGLPRSIENAVRRDPYHRGNAHISVTGLISPARKRALEIRHSNELTEDVAERIWSLMGQIAHGILERADDAAWCEERLYIERHGWRISGQFDRYLLEQDGLLQDYKLTTTFSVKNGSKTEWDAQENIYALMLREHGYRVDRLEVVAILRDWQKAKSRHSPEYPQTPAMIIPVALWPNEQVETYIKARLIAHGKAQHELPECTPDERWERPDVWALRKSGSRRAISLHASQEDAEHALVATVTAHPKIKYEIEERPAQQIRCADYCPALIACDQGKALLQRIDDFYSERNVWVVNRAARNSGDKAEG